jgi:HTH-type transcriptional regulator, transcriptional repressor of NAD biosynthesis genes
MSKTRGLTLGKFAPLHKGHQLVIETALRETDEVMAIIYDCPETTDVPLPVRANWLRTLYPSIQVVEAWDGPLEVGDTDEIRKTHENYILNQLKIRDVTHFYSSEFYGEHMSRALGAVNRVVDNDRSVVPVSATDIRKDPFAFRSFLHPLVYKDLVTKVVFLGAPSTGKTTIAERLAKEYETVWMPEYGREYWHQKQVGRRLSLEQLEEIAEGHLVREDELLQSANRYLFCDTNALTTFMFAVYYHGASSSRLEDLADQAVARYDVVFLCDSDIPYDDTWDRSGALNRDVFQKQIVADLIMRKVPYITLRGSVEERSQYVKEILNKYRKYSGIPDRLLR